MIYRKSVILSSLDNSSKKAVINIESKAGNVGGTVKLFNFIEEPMGVLSLGLLVDGNVHKAGLSRVGYMTYSFKSILTQIPTSCTFALVSSRNGNSEPLLIGSSIMMEQSIEQRLIQSLSALTENSMEKVKQTLDNNQIYYEDEKEIEQEIDNCLNEDCNFNCLNCNYKKAFYDTFPQANSEKIIRQNKQVKAKDLENAEDDVEISNELEKDITKGKLRVPENQSADFIDEIGDQIDLLFKKYPHEEILADIIPNSKWVKVDFNNDNKFYVVGLIYEGEKVKYICYGIPAKWTEFPPADFNEKAQWLPIDLEFPQGEGYWITYQDAIDGNLIQVEIV